MKFIHTSDWHLGRAFGPVSLRSDQEAFADWFVDLAVDEDVELVMIAGDLYDRAVAPTEAIELFRDTVGRLLGHGVVVAAITGNHDGADRVAPYDTLLDASGFYLRGGYAGAGGVITHRFADGDVDLVLLPYLDPRLAPDDFGVTGDPVAPDAPSAPTGASEDGGAPTGADRDADTGARGEHAPMGAAGEGVGEPVGDADGHDVERALERRRRRTHQSVLADATALARPALRSARSIAVAHAFVTGGTTSDSERQLTVGGTSEVAAAVFAGFSYTALGHLHRPQDLAGTGSDEAATLRYSGTPLAYSFSEEHDKSVTVVEMDPSGAIRRRIEPVGVGRAVRTLTGTIDDLLTDARHADATGCFIRAVLTDRSTVLDAKDRLAARFPHIVEIELRPDGLPDTFGEAPADVQRRSPIEVTRAFWTEAEGAPPDEATDRLLVAAVRGATDAEHDGAPHGGAAPAGVAHGGAARRAGTR